MTPVSLNLSSVVAAGPLRRSENGDFQPFVNAWLNNIAGNIKERFLDRGINPLDTPIRCLGITKLPPQHVDAILIAIRRALETPESAGGGGFRVRQISYEVGDHQQCYLSLVLSAPDAR